MHPITVPGHRRPRQRARVGLGPSRRSPPRGGHPGAPTRPRSRATMPTDCAGGSAPARGRRPRAAAAAPRPAPSTGNLLIYDHNLPSVLTHFDLVPLAIVYKVSVVHDIQILS